MGAEISLNLPNLGKLIILIIYYTLILLVFTGTNRCRFDLILFTKLLIEGKALILRIIFSNLLSFLNISGSITTRSSSRGQNDP